MNSRLIKSLPALAFSGTLLLLAACTPAASVDPDVSDQPPDADTTAAATATGKGDGAQSTNIINRFWSPFDNAVDDINRDLNKGDADAPPESDE
ncbi:MAG: hypothetical protein PVF08_09745 [Gammaproteobacteria bacterium]|jgi:hypothetical protein